jgi:integrase
MARSREGSIKLIGGVPYARIRWTDDSGRRREKAKKAESKTHARQLIKQMLRELDDYGSDSLGLHQKTFDELVEFYKQHHFQPAQYVGGRKVSGQRSLKKRKYIIEVLKVHFGKKRLRSITYGDMERFRITRINTPTVHGKARSVTTVNRELEVLRNMLNVALREGWIHRNPFTSGPPLIQKAHEKTRERILTLEEEERLLAACTGRRAHLRPLIICALDTGMRRGEILSLVWSDIDFVNRLIHVKAFNTKTERERWLALTPRLENELIILHQKSNKQLDEKTFGINDNFKKAFAYVRKLAGLSELRFHDLRHSAATRMVQMNVPLPLVGRILGHTQANTTMRYVNANVETARVAAEALAAFTRSEKDDDHLSLPVH